MTNVRINDINEEKLKGFKLRFKKENQRNTSFQDMLNMLVENCTYEDVFKDAKCGK